MVFWGMIGEGIPQASAIAGGVPSNMREDSKLLRWDAHFMAMCMLTAKMSKDESTKVGAVITGYEHEVLSTGFNGIPRYCEDNNHSRQQKPQKYMWFEHAERNAIYNAAKNGIRLDGATLYCSAPSCAECARGVIQSGIRKVVFPRIHAFMDRDDWKNSFVTSLQMLDEASVKIRWLEGKF